MIENRGERDAASPTYGPLLDKLLHLGKRFSGFVVLFIAVAMCLALGDCYGWVPHGPWYRDDGSAEVVDEKRVWAQQQFEDCQDKCLRAHATTCVQACAEVYAAIMRDGDESAAVPETDDDGKEKTKGGEAAAARVPEAQGSGTGGN
jgi:hypothetical protein